MLRLVAKQVASWHREHGIPARLLTDAQLLEWDRKGRKAKDGGIVTHAQMSRVFKLSTHWDPGKWPSGTFLRMLDHELNG
jgi:hypothetical protein